MRKTVPPAVEHVAGLPPAEPTPPRAVLVKPALALPVEEDPPLPPRARVIDEAPRPPAAVPRAEPVQE
jgi:hypothetical protein